MHKESHASGITASFVSHIRTAFNPLRAGDLDEEDYLSQYSITGYSPQPASHQPAAPLTPGGMQAALVGGSTSGGGAQPATAAATAGTTARPGGPGAGRVGLPPLHPAAHRRVGACMHGIHHRAGHSQCGC